MKNPSVQHCLVFSGLFCVFTLLSSHAVVAQSTIDTVLSSILKNNKSIQAGSQYRETRKIELKTGLLPDNPQVEYDYLAGSPENAGNQTDVTVFQSFDFPSAYSKRKQLSDQLTAQVQQQFNSQRQEILMEAKLVCIDLVYRSKLAQELTRQRENAREILQKFEKKMEMGDGNILDVNKARIQLMAINRDFQENSSIINQLQAKLVSLNGGLELEFNDTIYFAEPEIPAFDQLESQYRDADPLRKLLEHEKIVVQKEMELSRALSYPKFQAGYRYQGILGQHYNGFHTGLTIPLWESRNTVKAKKSELLFVDLKIKDQNNEQYYRIKQLYEKYLYLRITVSDYKKTLNSVNASYLLNKSLSTGHISAIEYFMEMNYYSSALNSYLLMEKEYYQTVAELYKFML